MGLHHPRPLSGLTEPGKRRYARGALEEELARKRKRRGNGELMQEKMGAEATEKDGGIDSEREKKREEPLTTGLEANTPRVVFPQHK